MSGAQLSIVIPVYNEELVLEQAIRGLLAGLDQLSFASQIIIAENGSTDTTLSRARALAAQDSRLSVLHLQTASYGAAMRQGFLAAEGLYLANFSIDFMDLDFLCQAIDRLAEFDLVLGSKYLDKGKDRRPLPRRIAGQALSAFTQFLFGIPFADTHGLLAFRREPVIELVERCRYGHEIFDTELVVRSHHAGLHICELPVQVTETRPSRLGAFSRALRMIRQSIGLRLTLWRERRA